MSSTGTGVVVRYEPRGAALEFMKDRSAEVLLAGAAGTGKSLAMLFKLHITCLMVPGVRSLLVRQTHASLTGTTLVTFERAVILEALGAGIVSWFGGSARAPAAYKYSNGSVILVGGLDRPEKFLSSEFDRIAIDEATEITETALETLITRLRGNAPTYKQIVAACNPGAPLHFLKLRADRGAMKMMHSTHRDNPAYVNTDGSLTERGADYMSKLEALTGVRRLRLRDGLWAAAEGVIYDEFDPSIHLVDLDDIIPNAAEKKAELGRELTVADIPENWPRFWAVDFGFVNPFCCQMWAETPDGQLVLYREIYHTHKTVDQHAADIMACVSVADPSHVGRRGDVASSGRIWTEPKPKAVVCDHDAEGRATLAKELNLPTRAAGKKVKEGIERTQVRFRRRADGKPGLVFLRNALVRRDQDLADAKKPTCTVEELPAYIWDIRDGGKTKDEPVKENDHGADTMRYLCEYRDPKSRPSIRTT